MGLRSDGSAYVTGYTNSVDQALERVLDWTELSALSLGRSTALGLKKDGSLLVTGSYQRSDNIFVPAVQGDE